MVMVKFFLHYSCIFGIKWHCKVKTRVRIVKNELVGSATQQELRGWGSQWNEQGNWGVKPTIPVIEFEPW